MKAKDKKKILKAQEKNDSLCTSETLVSITANYSSATKEDRGQWDDTFEMQKEKYNCQPRISYPAQIFFINQKESHLQIKKTTTTLREFVASEYALQEILKNVLKSESKWLQTVILIHMKKRAIAEAIM